jgi:hypothetical protein
LPPLLLLLLMPASVLPVVAIALLLLPGCLLLPLPRSQ